MPINAHHPFKGRHFPGEVIVLCVRWYLRYPLSYEHVSELLAERGVEVDASCIWRWVQAYAPELNIAVRAFCSETSVPKIGASGERRMMPITARPTSFTRTARDFTNSYSSGRIWGLRRCISRNFLGSNATCFRHRW